MIKQSNDNPIAHCVEKFQSRGREVLTAGIRVVNTITSCLKIFVGVEPTTNALSNRFLFVTGYNIVELAVHVLGWTVKSDTLFSYDLLYNIGKHVGENHA